LLLACLAGWLVGCLFAIVIVIVIIAGLAGWLSVSSSLLAGRCRLLIAFILLSLLVGLLGLLARCLPACLARHGRFHRRLSSLVVIVIGCHWLLVLLVCRSFVSLFGLLLGYCHWLGFASVSVG
jgi:hypothetical protein